MTDPLGLIPGVSAGSISPVPPIGPLAPVAPGTDAGPSFKEVLMQNLEQVNRLQEDAAMAVEDLMSGKRDDLATVLMAQRKADEAFNLLLQIRNKLMDAYTELKEMRV